MPQDQQVLKRAILYARTSQDSEEEGTKLSIEEQLEAGRNLCQNQGYQIVGEYFDRNRSGRTYPAGSGSINLPKNNAGVATDTSCCHGMSREFYVNDIKTEP